MIIIADIHLGKETDSIMTDAGPSQTQDIQYRLQWILDETLRRNQRAIAVAGDIFNKVNPPTRHIAVFFAWLSACKSKGVEVYLFGGNHDAGVDWVNMQLFKSADLDNVTVFTGPTLETVMDGISEGNVIFWPHIPLSTREVISMSGDSVSEYVAKQFPGEKIVVTHGQVVQSEYTNDIFFEAGDAMPIDPAAFGITPGSGTIIAGHIHDHISYGAVHYPGSLTVNNFGEVDEAKGFIDLNVQTGESEWFPFPEEGITPWRHVVLDLTEKDETQLDPEAIESIAAGAVLKLTILAKKHGIINESAIRDMFNKYGRVTRFETKVEDTEITTVVHQRRSHQDLLADFVESADVSKAVKKLAISLGSPIIERHVNGN